MSTDLEKVPFIAHIRSIPVCVWKTFLLQAGCLTISSIFIQFVGHSMFKELVKTKYCPNTTAESSHGSDDVTHLEYNAIRYTALGMYHGR